MSLIPLQAYINITKRCNLRCKHCYSNSGDSKNDIDIKKLANLFNKIRPLRVMVSGGEPLLVYPKVKKLIDSLEYRPHITILTNGTLFNSQIKNFLKKYANDITISLDCTSKEVFQKIRGRNYLIQVMKNIKNIKKLKKEININYTIFSSNQDELENVIFFMKKNKLKKLNIIRPRLIGRYSKNKDKLDVVNFYKSAIKLCDKNNIKLSLHDPLSNILKMKKYKTKCHAGEYMFSIDADFNIKQCPFLKKVFKGDPEKILKQNDFCNSACRYACMN